MIACTRTAHPHPSKVPKPTKTKSKPNQHQTNTKQNTKQTNTKQTNRRKGFLKGRNFNHTPHEAGSSSGTVHCLVHKGFVPPTLNPHQEALLG